jgi:hypothetical protein
MHIRRLSVLHGEQCHLCFGSIQAAWQVGTGSGRLELAVGQVTAGNLSLESGTYNETLKNVEQVFLSISVDKKAGILGLPSLTAMNN